MKCTQPLGVLFIQNAPKYKPFKVEYAEIDDNTLQLDVTGYGCINYFENLSEEIKLEINTDINNRLKDYQEITGHNSSEIGYSFELKQTKNLNRKYNTLETGAEISIVFNKPVIGACAKSLEPTIELISSIILSEIFILQ